MTFLLALHDGLAVNLHIINMYKQLVSFKNRQLHLSMCEFDWMNMEKNQFNHTPSFFFFFAFCLPQI